MKLRTNKDAEWLERESVVTRAVGFEEWMNKREQMIR